jgi:predicted RND superfamily exporter protein
MFQRVLDRGWIALVVLFLAAAAALGAFLPQVGVDASTNLLLDEKDPDLTYYSTSRRQWPSDDEFAIFCVRPPRGQADWFTAESVAALQEIDKDLAGVPHVKKVVSLLSVPLLRQTPLPLPVALTSKTVDLKKAREELTLHTLARGTFISEDGADTVLLAYLEQPPEFARLDRERTDAILEGDDARARASDGPLEAARAELRERRRAMVTGIRAVAAKWKERSGDEVRLSGLPIINLSLIEFVTHDVNTFGVASFLLFTAAFALIYRRIRWTALPIAACLLPVVLVLGLLGTMTAFPDALPDWVAAKFNGKLTVITANLPMLLFVVMLPYTVYFAERYRERRARGTGESHLESTAGAARDIWLPCLYSCTTTMAGFASLLTSGVKPVWGFGFLMTLGLGIGLACAFLFLPAAVRPLGALEEPGAKAEPEPSGLVRWLEAAVLAKPLVVIAAGALLLGAAIWGCTRITVENKFIDYFWPRTEVWQGLEYIDRRMGGTTPMDIVLTSPEEGFFAKPAGLEAIRAASAHIAAVPEVGGVTSLATLIDEIHKAKALAAMTVEGLAKLKPVEPLLRDVVTADYRTARVLVRFRETSPTLQRKRILTALRADLAGRTELAALAPRVTGVFLLYANMLESLLQSQKDTFGMVVLAIYAMLVVLFLSVDLRDRRPGASAAGAFVHAPLLSVVVLLPQVLPAVVVLGVMGWTGVPLDLITVTIAAIAMGVGIDAAIQYTVRYRIELAAAGGDRRAAITRSHATIGRSIWIATSIMVIGFAVLALSDFVPTVMFGLFNALAMLMGQFAALTMLPALFLVTGLPRR